jgi:hypothetical protein
MDSQVAKTAKVRGFAMQDCGEPAEKAVGMSTLVRNFQKSANCKSSDRFSADLAAANNRQR